MIKQQTTNPPHYVYPVDEWKIIENRYYPQFIAGTETLFALSNGYLGMRGCFEEGAPMEQDGTFVNPLVEIRTMPPGEPIPDGHLAAFFERRDETLQRLSSTHAPVSVAAQ